MVIIHKRFSSDLVTIYCSIVHNWGLLYVPDAYKELLLSSFINWWIGVLSFLEKLRLRKRTQYVTREILHDDLDIYLKLWLSNIIWFCYALIIIWVMFWSWSNYPMIPIEPKLLDPPLVVTGDNYVDIMR